MAQSEINLLSPDSIANTGHFNFLLRSGVQTFRPMGGEDCYVKGRGCWSGMLVGDAGRGCWSGMGMLVRDSKSTAVTIRQLVLPSVELITGRLVRKKKWLKCWEEICDVRGVNHPSKYRLMLNAHECS